MGYGVGVANRQTGRSYKEAATGAIFVITLHVIALIMMMVRMTMVRMMLLMPECYFCKNPSCDCLELDLRSSRRHITHILHDELQFNAIGSYY